MTAQPIARIIVSESLPTKVLVLTTYDLDSLVHAALDAGAAGFLLKATPPDRLVAVEGFLRPRRISTQAAGFRSVRG